MQLLLPRSNPRPCAQQRYIRHVNTYRGRIFTHYTVGSLTAISFCSTYVKLRFSCFTCSDVLIRKYAIASVPLQLSATF